MVAVLAKVMVSVPAPPVLQAVIGCAFASALMMALRKVQLVPSPLAGETPKA